MKLIKEDKYNKIIKFLHHHEVNVDNIHIIEIKQNIHEIYDILIKNRLPKTDIGNTYKGLKCELNKNYKPMLKYYLLGIESNHPTACGNVGNYYGNVEKNYDLMKKYHLMAIDLNNDRSMNSLGYYYRLIEKNVDLMKKYYLMAINLNNSSSMNNLGYYYHDICNYDLMKIYYLMAIDFNSRTAMGNLGHYYQYVEKNYDLMKKYYLMAIDLNSTLAMNNLAIYYIDVEKNGDPMEKYYLMAINLNHSAAMINLQNYYNCCIEYYGKYKFYNLLVALPNKNELINNKINEFSSDTKIIRLQMINVYDEKCIVCLESAKCIKYYDTCINHYICKSCYLYTKKCPFRCTLAID